MLIVPLRGDRIKVTGIVEEMVVNSYSALKEGGAVYVKQPLDPKSPFVVLSMIQAVNGILVGQRPTGLLQPKGLVKRKLNLPQVGDSIEVIIHRDSQGIEEKAFFVVEDLKLTSKPLRPLEVTCKNEKFSLADVINIKRKLGFEKFDLSSFRKLYLDYFPVGSS